MVVPQKRNHRGGLVGRERVSQRGSRGGLIRRPGVDESVAKTTRRRLGQVSVGCVALPPFASRRRCRRRRPLRRRRVRTSRQRESHWRGSPARFRHASNPTKTPTKRPTKNPSVQVTASPGRALRSALDDVARRLAKASVQLACHSRTCRPADTCAGAPREHGPAGPCSRRAGSVPRAPLDDSVRVHY
jgi:hypothetical protein